ncbi:MAG: hypothetical protein ACTHOF_10090 [Flavisolibacter sp.]
MKRVIVSVLIVFGITATAAAQTTQKKTSKTKTTISSQTSHQAKAKTDTTAITTKASASKISTPKLSNRKIYHWTNGQRSTPTGEAATSSNGNSYAALKKDTAKVVKKGKQ